MARAGRIIRKYPNRRLYDTFASSYITLAQVRQMVLKGTELVVEDSRTQEDITRNILLQIVMEEEESGQSLFTTDALKRLIHCHGQSMQAPMRVYLEKNLQIFNMIHDRLKADAATGRSESGAELHAPVVQNMISTYMEQAAHLFLSQQENPSQQ